MNLFILTIVILIITLSTCKKVIYSFGSNDGGKLGFDTFYQNSQLNTKIPSGIKIKKMESNHQATQLLTESNELYNTGENNFGQLGRGDFEDRNLFGKVSALNGLNIIDVSGRMSYSTLVLTSDNKIYGFGKNGDGELGLGDTINRTLPINISFFNDKNVRNISMGFNHALILTADSKVYTMGSNTYGQLGINTTIDSNVPIEITALTGKNVVKVYAGREFSHVITSDFKVYSFGINNQGQLALGDNTNKLTPIENSYFPEFQIKEIHMVHKGAIAIGFDGGVHSWGFNVYGELGKNLASSTPIRLSNLNNENIHTIVTGRYHTLCIGSSKVFGFGRNLYGSLGLGDTQNRLFPVEIPSLENKNIIGGSAGNLYTILYTFNNDVYVIGNNEFGNLGNGKSTLLRSPTVTDQTVTTFTKFKRHAEFTLALSSNSKLYSFGANSNNQLGHGDSLSRTTATLIKTLENKTVTQFEVGAEYSYVVTSDDKVYSFGANSFGQLGHGDGVNRVVPTEVIVLSGKSVKSLHLSFYHVIALTNDNTAYGVGSGNGGCLGLNITTAQYTPVLISSLNGMNIKSVALGTYFTLVLDDNNKLYGFGKNDNGQLGLDDTVIDQILPLELPFFIGKTIEQIDARYQSTFVRTSNSQIYAFGGNSNGQLCVGDKQSRFTPVLVTNLIDKNIVDVKVAWYNSFFKSSTSKLYSCGLNTHYQLGVGVKTDIGMNPQEISNTFANFTASEFLVSKNAHSIVVDTVLVCFNKIESDSTVCSGNGTCIANDQCKCNSGMEGIECDSWSCFGVSKTSNSTCSSNGICVSPNVCQCTTPSNSTNCDNNTVNSALSVNSNLCLIFICVITFILNIL